MKPNRYRWARNSQEQKATLAARLDAYAAADSRRRKLESRLLSLGGLAVVSQGDQADADDTLPKLLGRRAKMIDGKSAMLVSGVSRECHQNAVSLSKLGSVRVATGWALSDDGLWRRHSWGAWAEHVVETTVARDLYFGYVLRPAEVVLFEKRVTEDGS